jgi:hypothetical protein
MLDFYDTRQVAYVSYQSPFYNTATACGFFKDFERSDIEW